MGRIIAPAECRSPFPSPRLNALRPLLPLRLRRQVVDGGQGLIHGLGDHHALAGGGEIVVENSYLDLTNGRFRRGDAEIEVDGRFSLGGPRDDGGEELNTVFSMSSFPAANIRAAFGLVDGYTVDGPVTGEGHLYGAYPRPFGVGRLTLDHPVAYGEPFDSWSADLRFEGDGVWLNGLEMRKGAGTITGAAFIVAVGIGALAGRIGIDPQWGILFFVIGIALALVRAAMSEGRGGQG